MTSRYPSLAVLGLAGACALLASPVGRADVTPPPAAAASSASAALTGLEALAPKESKDPVAIAASHAWVIALIEGNTLETGEDYRRAALLLQFHLGEFRIVRLAYELMVAAAAKGDAVAEKALAIHWDQFMGEIGRPARFDFSGWAQQHPEYAEYEPAPACIQAVWRDPAAARAALAGVADNAEVVAIRDADQADRQGNWNARSEEERNATMARDKARNARTREIVAAGDLRTANDFARAALVLQHSARFAGYRLAHELAVASMLLGDRGSGRWLVAASYDRMLRGTGLDQRFGTQYGPNGPLPVDEAGICDNQRTALGCPTLAQARNRQPPVEPAADKRVQEITKPDRWLHDEKTGLRVRHPEGWVPVRVVAVDAKATSILFQLTGRSDGTNSALYYRLEPPPGAGTDPEAALREQAAVKEKDRQTRSPDYRNRSDSFAFRRVNGQPALAWSADYGKGGVPWAEYLVRVTGPGSVGLFLLNAPADQIEALKPAVDAMAETVQLP